MSSDAATTRDVKVHDLPDGAVLVRPCEVYWEEYADCKSIKAKFHQYFIHGSTVDCSSLKEDYKNCGKYHKEGDLDSLKKVIDSEYRRIDERELSIQNNTVWTLREKPPEDWAKPLSVPLQKRSQNSYLALKYEEKNDGATDQNKSLDSKCVIL